MKATLLLLTMFGTLAPTLQAQTQVPMENRMLLKTGDLAGGPGTFELPGTSVPLPAVTEMMIRQDRTSAEGASRGGVVGLLIGGGIGVLAGLKATRSECRQPPGAGCMIYDVIKAAAPVFGGILGAGAGALIGGVIGSVRPGEHWVRITVPM